jgi:threonine aldolase
MFKYNLFTELEETVAEMFEKEAALFMPTGTMANLCAGSLNF